MFNLQITHHNDNERLASKTRELIKSECERLNQLSSNQKVFNFNLFSADGDGGVTILSGVAFNFQPSERAKYQVPLDAMFILDSLHLEGTAMNLDNMDASLDQFIKRWTIKGVVSYAVLLEHFKQLDENTHIVLSKQ